MGRQPVAITKSAKDIYISLMVSQGQSERLAAMEWERIKKVQENDRVLSPGYCNTCGSREVERICGVCEQVRKDRKMG